jgi:hypothetical protein
MRRDQEIVDDLLILEPAAENGPAADKENEKDKEKDLGRWRAGSGNRPLVDKASGEWRLDQLEENDSGRRRTADS